MIVACVGRRDLEHWETDYLVSCGGYLRQAGHMMTSGGAPGADSAYALGFTEGPGQAPLELYLPWKGFGPRKGPMGLEEAQSVFYAAQATQEHRELAELACQGRRPRDTVWPLFVRNAMIVRRFAQPVDVVWAYPDRTRWGWGGTGHAMRVAQHLGIKVVILPESREWDGRLE